MARKNKEIPIGDCTFLDKTNLRWYNKEGTDQVTFCGSLKDIVEGKGDAYSFREKLLSNKVISKNEQEIAQNNLNLFILTDGRFILARKHDEMK
jgi:pantothenate kinase